MSKEKITQLSKEKEKKPKIMIIDDNKEYLSSIERGLITIPQAEGNLILFHYQGQTLEEIIKEIEFQNPTILLFDHHLQEDYSIPEQQIINGLVITEEVKSKFPRITIYS
ncbi:MAG: hypothetical protein NZ866_02115, partial [Patescibacteria group bacterium]|nr:hypothetical protein [Patescibacteria group bacterium]